MFVQAVEKNNTENVVKLQGPYGGNVTVGFLHFGEGFVDRLIIADVNLQPFEK